MNRRAGAFTLLELMAVMAVIAVLVSLSLPAFTTILRGNDITRAADLLTSQLNMARQQAIADNRKVEVRFYKYVDSTIAGDSSGGSWHALQPIEINSFGMSKPLNKVQKLPDSVVIDESSSFYFSSVLSLTAHAASTPIPQAGTNYTYASFVFNPDGSTDLSPANSTPWFLTIRAVNKPPAGTTLPPNFATISIDAINGTTRTFRPGG